MARSIAELRQFVMSSSQYNRDWLKPDDAFGWMIVAKIMGPFFATIVLLPHFVALGFGPVAIPISYILLGIYGYKMTFVLHETCHNSLFATVDINRLVGTVAGYITGTKYEIFRDIHMLHHRCNGTADDPQLEDFLGHEYPLTRTRVKHHIMQRLYCGDLLSFLAHYFPFVPKSWRKEHRYQNTAVLPQNTIGFYVGVVAMQVMIALLITNFLRYPLLALLFPLSAVFLSLFLTRIRACAEHMRTNDIVEKDFSRSHRPNGFDRFFFYDANFNYHLEHHIFPHMPACNLPKFSQTFEPHIHDSRTLGHSITKTILAMVRQLPV